MSNKIEKVITPEIKAAVVEDVIVKEDATKELLAELANVKSRYDKLEEMVMLMSNAVNTLLDAKSSKGTKIRNIEKPVPEHGLIAVKKIDVDGKEIEVYEYDTFVMIEGHRRKIYENKRGRMFSAAAGPVYLKSFGLQAHI